MALQFWYSCVILITWAHIFRYVHWCSPDNWAKCSRIRSPALTCVSIYDYGCKRGGDLINKNRNTNQ